MDGSKVLSEMDTVLNAVSAAADAADALPFESIDDFSTDPVSFAEMSERMLEKVEFIFDLSTIYNRQSEEYLKICAILEKGIKYLASSCITKAALDQAKKNIPTLGQLSLEKLYGMASFNYRKLDTALTEQLKKKGRDFSPELLDMDFRYYHLLLRLRATEQKKHDYFLNYYYGSNGNYLTHMGCAFNNGVHSGPTPEPPVFRKAPAFPINKDAVIELCAKQGPDENKSLKLPENKIEVSLKNTKKNNRPAERKTIQSKRSIIPELPSGFADDSLNDLHKDHEEFLKDTFDTEGTRGQGSGGSDQSDKRQAASGMKVSDVMLQKEFDDEMKKTWARFTAYVEEERKGRSAPPGR